MAFLTSPSHSRTLLKSAYLPNTISTAPSTASNPPAITRKLMRSSLW